MVSLPTAGGQKAIEAEEQRASPEGMCSQDLRMSSGERAMSPHSNNSRQKQQLSKQAEVASA
jgi:hypothetical protein